MTDPSISSSKFFKTACNFEGSLIIVAAGLGWIADINPFEHLFLSEHGILFGILGTLPLLIMFVALEQIDLKSVRKIRSLLIETLGQGLNACSWTDLFLLAAMAGFSEELLFRGVIQPWLENSWGFTFGIIGCNIIFGLVHAVTPLYALLAAIVGIYLSFAMDYSGTRDLLTPILIHGLYDFFAFMMIMRTFRQEH